MDVIAEIVYEGKQAAEVINLGPEHIVHDAEIVPINPYVASQIEPGDRFVYDVNITPVSSVGDISHATLVSIASSVGLSKEDIAAIGIEELLRRAEASPEAFGLSGAGDGEPDSKHKYDVDVLFTEAGY